MGSRTPLFTLLQCEYRVEQHHTYCKSYPLGEREIFRDRPNMWLSVDHRFGVVTLLMTFFATPILASEWIERPSRIVDNAQHELIFWLQAANSSALHAAVDRVSDPNSPSFRKYLHDDEIARLVAPRPASVVAFKEWIQEKIKSGRHTIRRSRHGDFFFVKAHVDDWGRAFGRKLSWYEHGGGKAKPILRLAGLDSGDSLGSDVHVDLKDVRAVFGLSDFYPALSRRSKSDSTCMVHFLFRFAIIYLFIEWSRRVALFRVQYPQLYPMS